MATDLQSKENSYVLLYLQERMEDSSRLEYHRPSLGDCILVPIEWIHSTDSDRVGPNE